MSRSYACVQFPEAIGTCEFCGSTDHHLVEGLCPICRPKTVNVGTPGHIDCGTPALGRHPISLAALDRMATAALLAIKRMARTEEVPLGAEASVSHVRVPKGRAR